MLKEHTKVIRKLTIFTDLSVVAVSFLVGYRLWKEIHYLAPLHSYLLLLPGLLLIWGSFLYHFDVYNSFRVKSIIAVLFSIVKAGFFSFVACGTFMYLFKTTNISRLFIVFVFMFASLCIALEKVMALIFLRCIRSKGLNYREILIVGTGKRAQTFMNLLEQHAEWGFKIVGFIDEDQTKVGQTIGDYSVLGTFTDILQILHTNVVDDVAFIVPRSWLDRIQKVMHFCEAEGLKIHLAVDYVELKFSKAKQTDLHGFPLLTFESTPDQMWHLLIKRLVDLTVSGFLLVALWPLFAVVAFLIGVTSHGPVFFKQERCSLNGRRFTLFKFRTMYPDAQTRLNELRQHNEMTGPVFKMKNDPRITLLGKFLRKTSIDELPQLWNVFKGDMSLVGPRPSIPEEVAQYDSWQRRRLSMRPGITCLWQINGRSRIKDFNRWVKLDLEYIDNWSLFLDMRILLQTIPVVFFGIGSK
jgi:exopolysaccharide biosynthesis polyprenyl glycosylphosphotransferase